MLQNMPAMHRDHRCLSGGSAQLLYIKEASSGVTHYGLHLYRLRSSKKDERRSQHDRSSDHSDVLSRSSMDTLTSLERLPASVSEALLSSTTDMHSTGTVWLGICGRGIDIYEVRLSKLFIFHSFYDQFFTMFCRKRTVSPGLCERRSSGPTSENSASRYKYITLIITTREKKRRRKKSLGNSSGSRSRNGGYSPTGGLGVFELSPSL